MRFRKKSKDPTEWHDFFCLFPMITIWTDTEFEFVWLETIQRRKRYLWLESFWEYRLKEG